MPPKLIIEVLGDTSKLEKSFKRANRSAQSFSVGVLSSQRSLGGLTRAASLTSIGIGAALGGAFVSTISKAASFEKSLNVLQAVTGASADRMRDAATVAKRLGADMTLPKTSAADAAVAMTELAKGGLSVKNTLDAAKGSLQLAAAANITAGEAAQIAARQLNAFQLEGKQAGRVADVLANVANVATGEITDFAIAFQQSSAVANQFGLTLEDTAAALAVMANRGIVGSDAGTSLRVMLTRLVPQTAKATEAMATLGIKWKESNGQIKPFRAQLQQYHDVLKQLTPAQRQQAVQTIFGADAQRAANIIFGASPAIFDRMHNSVSRQGAAAKLAAAQNKGFSGALDGLKSATETLQITLGTKLLPTLTNMVKGLQQMVVAFDKAATAGGGTGAALALLATTALALKFRGVISGLSLVSLNAKSAALQVGVLRSRLLSLGGIGPIVIPVALAFGAKALSESKTGKRFFLDFSGIDLAKDIGGAVDKFVLQRGGGGGGGGGRAGPAPLTAASVWPAIISGALTPERLRGLRGRFASAAGFAAAMDAAQSIAGAAFGSAGGGTTGRRPKGLAALSGLERNALTLAQGETVGALSEQRRLLAVQIEKVQRQFSGARGKKASDLAVTLQALYADDASALARIQSINEGAARDAKSAADAMKAAAKKRKDAIKKRNDAIRDLVASALGKTSLGVAGGPLTLGQVNKAIAAGEQGRQFRALGLTSEGGQRAPGLKGLKAMLGNLEGDVKGTALDTDKMRSRFAIIRKVISGEFGKAREDVRRTVKGMLDDIDSQLGERRGGSGFRHLSPNKLAEALGLGGGRDATRRAAGVLAQIGAGGKVPQRSQAFAGSGGITIHGGLHLNGVQDVRKLENELAKRQKGRPQVRRGLL